MNGIKRPLEAMIIGSRWLVAPFLLGLIVGLVALLYTFVLKLAGFVMELPTSESSIVIIGVLNLIDLTLTANLIVIVISSSYEYFVSPVDPTAHPSWPKGLSKIGFSGLKEKVLGSIVAIAAVNVLEWFMDIDRQVDNQKLAWVVGILMAFAIAMLVLAIADRIGDADGSKDH
ncbi:MAG TPA: YqhA family protein [Xanthobacteraceae bacterium]|jgi:uncharacterized protein (TIGR00645 family)|nr:YqhA family protein [Xanthobacteraceae bacterium]